jgi:hypothetical protein
LINVLYLHYHQSSIIMNKWLKIFIGLVIVGMIAAGLGYKFIYNKPHTDYEKAMADFKITSQELFSDYQNVREAAEKKYNGKVLEINGFLNQVETPDSLTIAVFVLDEGMFGDEGIRFTMLSNHSEKIVQYIGKTLKIKGYCTGYNDTDVIMEKCSIVE